MRYAFTILAITISAAFAQRTLTRTAPDAAPATALGAQYMRENYTKFEYRIPMRDGVKLFTSVYVPKDVAYRRAQLSHHDDAHALQRRALRRSISIRAASALPNSSRARNSSSSIRMCAAAIMSEGEYVAMRPYKPVKNGPRISTRAPTPTTPSTG